MSVSLHYNGQIKLPYVSRLPHVIKHWTCMIYHMTRYHESISPYTCVWTWDSCARSSGISPGGGGYSHKWPIWVCAAPNPPLFTLTRSQTPHYLPWPVRWTPIFLSLSVRSPWTWDSCARSSGISPGGGGTPISDLYGYVRPQTPHYLPWPVPKPPTIYPDPFAEPPSFYPCPFEVHTKSTGARSFTVNCEIIYL